MRSVIDRSSVVARIDPPPELSVTQTQHDEPGTRATPSRRWALHVVRSPDPAWEGATLVVEGRTVLGRTGGGAAVTIDDRRLSRAHVELRRHHGLERVELADLGSKNGTFVGGQRVQRATLSAGDVVRVGSTVAVFDEAAAPEELDPVIGGRSAALRRLLSELDRVAHVPIPVLLLGETGTGKELLARRLHTRSARSGACIPVNCGAIVADLTESQFFGHRKGAFTGATETSRGLVREAAGGTLFLDEVGEMPIGLQPKLLRVLETGEVTPVGSNASEIVDLRVVAATNVDLLQAIEAGSFRADLYARLAGYVVHVPPLRERRVDVLSLLHRFVDEARPGVPLRLSATLAERLLLHRWPMNVRELRSLARRFTLLDPSDDEIGQWPGGEPEPEPPPREAPRALESVATPSPGRGGPPAEELRELLRRHAGSVARLAEHYGKERRQIYRWLQRHGIDPDRFRDEPG